MQTDLFIVLFVVATSIFYMLVLMSGRVGSRKDFYTSQSGVSPLARGMGLAADWLCAATLIGLFGLISHNPQEAQWMLTGWIAGLLLLSIIVAPAVYDSGQLSSIDFIAQKFDSISLRWLMNFIVIAMGILLLALQMKGLGLILSRHLQLPLSAAIAIGMILLFFYTVLSNLRAITRVQMLKYCIVFCSVMVASVYIAVDAQLSSQWVFLQSIFTNRSFDQVPALTYYSNPLPNLTIIEIIFSLIVLAAGVSLLPYMLKRFQGVKLKADIRFSAIWMLVFVGVIYSSVPWMAHQAHERLYQSINGPLQEGGAYSRMPNWLFLWEYTQELSWIDKNNDGRIQWLIQQNKSTDELSQPDLEQVDNFALVQQSIEEMQLDQQEWSLNEFSINDEIRLLLLPELFAMPNWVIALVTIGVTAALLSTASMVLISTVYTFTSQPSISAITERYEALVVKGLALLMLIVAAVVAINLTGSLIEWFNRVLQLAAASLFPAFMFALMLPRLPKVAILAGMLIGLLTSLGYSVVYEMNSLSSFWPSALPSLSPLPMTVMWMTLNAISVLLLAWVINLRAASGDAKSDDTC
ncbi:MAG: hypothetical protein EA373_05605 [Oceanospirillales bacterium]|nr:MAG: hypothetical protein EA373_05605 [Oceanospirillales bacterium]